MASGEALAESVREEAEPVAERVLDGIGPTGQCELVARVWLIVPTSCLLLRFNLYLPSRFGPGAVPWEPGYWTNHIRRRTVTTSSTGGSKLG